MRACMKAGSGSKENGNMVACTKKPVWLRTCQCPSLTVLYKADGLLRCAAGGARNANGKIRNGAREGAAMFGAALAGQTACRPESIDARAGLARSHRRA